MDTTCKRTPRSGWEFEVRDKAYHSYMYSLQKKNYGETIRGYARAHNLKRDTLRSWIERYPGGRPFYDADDATLTAPNPPKEEVQIVKLSQSQLEKPVSVSEMVSCKTNLSEIIKIEYCGASIQVSAKDVIAVLAAIKSISGLVH